jgi:hypothetical protein
MTTSKNGKVTTTKNGVNIDNANLALASKLQATLNLEGEFKVYLEIDALNEKGLLSVNGIRATLQEVEKVGSAPSLKSDYAQQFPIVREMRKMKGAENKTLKELFNLAVQGRKTFGTDTMTSKVAEAKTIAGLSKAVKVAKDEKAETAKRGAGKETADEKKAGKAKQTPATLAIGLAEYLEKGGSLPEDILERLIDAVNLAIEGAEEKLVA